MSSARSVGSGTASMRESIHNQIQRWAEQAHWVDDEKVERITWKMSQTTEDFISPNPGADYREEASRIYQELKDEHGLRTVAEAARESDEYDRQAQAHAEHTLRANVEAIDAGDDELVDDVADEYGREWVESVLADERIHREQEGETLEAPEPTTDETPGPRDVETADDVRDIVAGELANMSWPEPDETGLDAETVRMVVRDELEQRDAGTVEADETRDDPEPETDDDDETPGPLARLGSWLVGVGETLDDVADTIEQRSLKAWVGLLMILGLRAGRRALSVPVRLVAWSVTVIAIATTLLADDLARIADDLGDGSDDDQTALADTETDQ